MSRGSIITAYPVLVSLEPYLDIHDVASMTMTCKRAMCIMMARLKRLESQENLGLAAHGYAPGLVASWARRYITFQQTLQRKDFPLSEFVQLMLLPCDEYVKHVKKSKPILIASGTLETILFTFTVPPIYHHEYCIAGEYDDFNRPMLNHMLYMQRNCDQDTLDRHFDSIDSMQGTSPADYYTWIIITLLRDMPNHAPDSFFIYLLERMRSILFTAVGGMAIMDEHLIHTDDDLDETPYVLFEPLIDVLYTHNRNLLLYVQRLYPIAVRYFLTKYMLVHRDIDVLTVIETPSSSAAREYCRQFVVNIRNMVEDIQGLYERYIDTSIDFMAWFAKHMPHYLSFHTQDGDLYHVCLLDMLHHIYQIIQQMQLSRIPYPVDMQQRLVNGYNSAFGTVGE